MTPPPTLIDAFYQRTFEIPRLAYMRSTIYQARKFVLDTPMSAFVADLSLASFRDKSKSAKTRFVTLEHMRKTARAPFPVTWIEFDHRAMWRRRKELLPTGMITSVEEEIADKEGWLIVQDEHNPTVYHSTLVVGDNGTDSNHGLPHVNGIPSSLSWAWSVDDDTVPPYRSLELKLPGSTHSSIPLGIQGYSSPFVRVIQRPGIAKEFILKDNRVDQDGYAFLKEFTGDLRYTWALLSTLNHIPVEQKIVKQQRGFMGRGKFRKFMTHAQITLKVPKKFSVTQLARKVMALSRRRRHEVRGHFRKDWRHPGEVIWIDAHERGDATLGFVTHSYAVEKETS